VTPPQRGEDVVTTRILLIRHGESILGSRGRYAGHVNTPLSAEGRGQIMRLRRRFRRFRIDRVFSSDLRRCRETAEILAPGADVIFTKQLRELSFGRWEGWTSDECARRYPSRYGRWLDDPRRITPPGGESLDQLAQRVGAFVRRVARRFPGRTVALITHGGPIRVLLVRNLADFWTVDVPPAALIVHPRSGVREGHS